MQAPLDLKLLSTFVCAAHSGTLSAVAIQVGRTQSAVTMQIQRLEEALGQNLFHRSGSGVRLTGSGERFLAYAERILKIHDEAISALSEKGLHGSIIFGSPEDYLSAFFPALLKSFGTMYPDVEIKVVSAPTVELRTLLNARQIDLALVSNAHDGQGVVRTERLVWVGSRRHGVPEGDPVPLVAYGQGCIYRARAIHALESAGRRWRIAFTGSNLPAVQAAIACGFGIGILVARSVRDDLRILRPEEGFPPVPPSELAVMLQPGASPAVRIVAEQLAASCAEERPEAA